jgi:hypothetical protein
MRLVITFQNKKSKNQTINTNEQAGTAQQQDKDARTPPEKLVGRWIIIKVKEG